MSEPEITIDPPRQPVKDGGCEWDPERRAAALPTSDHYAYNAARFLVDVAGEYWRLCPSCSQRAPFKRFRRVRIPKGGTA